MTEETKQRLRERFEQILNTQETFPQPDKKRRTLADIERIALNIREEVAQATLEEIAKEETEQEKQTDVAFSISPPSSAIRSAITKLPCPHCYKNAHYKGIRRRNIQTLAGIFSLERAYYHCQRCCQGFAPQDAHLQIQSGHHFSIALAQEMTALCACLPYEIAMQTLRRLTPVTLSGRTAQRLCLGEASKIVNAFVQSREATMLPLVYLRQEQLPDFLPLHDILYLQVDGVHVPMKGGSSFEMKVGVACAEFPDGRVQMSPRYMSAVEQPATFAKRWESLGLICGSLKAKTLVILGDGAAWIWNLASKCFPLAVQILDFFHASGYVAHVARDIFGEDAAALKEWLSARLSQMKRSEWSAFWEAIDALSVHPAFDASLDSLVHLRTYFTNHASRMDYAHYLRCGFSIGSGLAESSCKRIVTERLKCSGMHWSVAGAEVIARVRGFFLGGEWEEFIAFWNAQAQTDAFA
jgi:hypothetical protein